MKDHQLIPYGIAAIAIILFFSAIFRSCERCTAKGGVMVESLGWFKCVEEKK